MLNDLFELVQREHVSHFQLKGTPMPAEITPRPAETNAEWPCNPINQTSIMLIALGRVFHSSKASGATPAGALTRPHGKNFTSSREKNP